MTIKIEVPDRAKDQMCQRLMTKMTPQFPFVYTNDLLDTTRTQSQSKYDAKMKDQSSLHKSDSGNIVVGQLNYR